MNFFSITSLYSVIFGNIEWTKIEKNDELVEILFHNYLVCEFTAHYVCRNAEMNMKSTTPTNRFNFQVINSLMELSWWVCLPWLDLNDPPLSPKLMSFSQIVDHQSTGTGCKELHQIKHNSTGGRQTLEQGPGRNGLILQPNWTSN